jgi:glucosamine 6-phosphate synthetase-like amidotransferase/phosphosugar isomerase protein
MYVCQRAYLFDRPAPGVQCQVEKSPVNQAGYSFLTDTDSEIAVNLYDRHGKSFVNHLRGEFALVIADSRTVWRECTARGRHQ